MVWPSGPRSKSETTPLPSPLQKSADAPIISLAGLFQLAEWIQDKHQLVQGGDPCRNAPQLSLPPRPACPLGLDQLWNRLTDEQRQQTLATLSVVVVRQLDAPRDEPEVRNEQS